MPWKYTINRSFIILLICLFPKISRPLHSGPGTPLLMVLKTSASRSQPKEITYRDYKQFDSSKFKIEPENVLTKENIDSCTKFDEQFLKILNSHTPLKRKVSRADQPSYISKTLQKVIRNPAGKY